MRSALLLVLLGFASLALPALAADGKDDDALILAVRADDLTAVEALLATGSDIDIRYSNGMTPVIRACAAGQTAIVESLLRHGADTTATDDQHYSALDYAMERPQYEATLRLLEHWQRNAGPDAGEIASLALAATRGDLPALDSLLKGGVAVDAEGASGYTALGLASRWQREAIVERLLAAGADPNRHSRSRYQTVPLMEAARDGNAGIGKRLLAAGARVNEGDKHGDHALNWAAYFGHAPFVRLMVEHGADLQRTGQTDDTPIEIAIREKHAGVIAILEAAGAKPRPGKEASQP